MEKQFVTFKIEKSFYCIDIMEVQEVIRKISVTPMPNFPSFVEGVMNLRGRIIPLLSIDKRLLEIDNTKFPLDGLGNTNSNNCIKDVNVQNNLKLIVVKIETIMVGLLVDALDKILTADENQIQSAEGIGKFSNHQMIGGILQVNNEIYTVLNPKFILEREETQLLTEKLNQ